MKTVRVTLGVSIIRDGVPLSPPIPFAKAEEDLTDDSPDDRTRAVYAALEKIVLEADGSDALANALRKLRAS